MRNMMTKAAIPVFLLLAIVLSPATASGPAISGKIAQIRVYAQPINFDPFDAARTRFGALEWRGGLVLTSDHDKFGGFSGLALNGKGDKMVAVSDRGWWMSAVLKYDAGRLSGLQNVRFSKLLNARGRPLKGKRWKDSESIVALDPGGDLSRLLVSFERRHRILKYAFGKKGLRAAGRAIKTPGALKSLKYNKGLEAIAVFGKNTAQKGAIIALSERSLDKNGNIRGWILNGPFKGDLKVLRRNEYDLTDAETLPGGDLLILERKLSMFSGLQFRIRRIASATIRPGAVLDGKVLIESGMNRSIDNMEGMSLHTAPDGELRLTLISDDNFSILQRTLLLQFALPGKG